MINLSHIGDNLFSSIFNTGTQLFLNNTAPETQEKLQGSFWSLKLYYKWSKNKFNLNKYTFFDSLQHWCKFNYSIDLAGPISITIGTV